VTVGLIEPGCDGVGQWLHQGATGMRDRHVHDGVPPQRLLQHLELPQQAHGVKRCVERGEPFAGRLVEHTGGQQALQRGLRAVVPPIYMTPVPALNQ
jgi:hypothetical protein